MNANRRLAAIMVADVVGYSRMMEQDEAGTLAALKERRKGVLEPVVKAHGGRIVKLMGDGVLVEFSSAVNAVQGAIELQKQIAAANEGVDEMRQIVLRIGINLGDVIGEGSDIYGEGVNIAARLEALAEPGGICISDKIRAETRGKVEIESVDMGEQTLRNIAAPVRAYRLSRQGTADGAYSTKAPVAKPTVAVLPFDNMSGDVEQQYFSDGFTEDIIAELSRFRALSIIARNSSFQYRNKAVDVRRIGTELGARYIVEGSIRRLGGRIRITAQLIDATHGSHIWSERFDREQEDIFSLQDTVVRAIVSRVAGRVEAAAIERARRKPPSSLAAYDCVLRGHALSMGDKDNETEARQLFEKAIELDPGYALAYAMLAYSLMNEWLEGNIDDEGVKHRALAMGKRAVELDEANEGCCTIFAYVLINHRQFETAEYYNRRALELNEGNPYCAAGMGEFLGWTGKADEGLDWFERAKKLDANFNPPWWWRSIGICLFTARRYLDAIEAFKRSPILAWWVHAYLAAALAHADAIDQARIHAATVLGLRPDFSSKPFAEREPYKHEADRHNLVAGLRKAGLPE